MRTELQALTETGMSLNDVGMYENRILRGYMLSLIERMLARADVKGFPIIASHETRTLGGYIGRTELHYLIGMGAPETIGYGAEFLCLS